MSDKKTINVSVGNIIPGLLGIAFVVLKLTGVIGWPWVWVLAPFWIPLAMWLGTVLVFVVILLVAEVLK